MAGLLLVTAPSADHKSINNLLLHLRDWEFGSGDRFHLATTRNAYDLDEEKTTTPPVPPDISNAWTNASLTEIEAFALDLSVSGNTTGVNPSIYVLLDEQGLQDKTCILGERHYDDETEERVDSFDKVRIPWEHVYIVWCNLDIANANFEDYCLAGTERVDGDGNGDGDGFWWVFNEAAAGGGDLGEANRRRRDEEIIRLSESGGRGG